MTSKRLCTKICQENFFCYRTQSNETSITSWRCRNIHECEIVKQLGKTSLKWNFKNFQAKRMWAENDPSSSSTQSNANFLLNILLQKFLSENENFHAKSDSIEKTFYCHHSLLRNVKLCSFLSSGMKTFKTRSEIEFEIMVYESKLLTDLSWKPRNKLIRSITVEPQASESEFFCSVRSPT